MDKVKDVLGAAGSGKYLYQAGRAFAGLETTTRLTAGLDMASGAVGLGSANNVAGVARSASTAAKGVVGAAKISDAAKIAGYASKAAPILAKGSAVLGGVLGGVEIGQGIHNLSKGNQEKGTEQVVSGSCDVVTAGALYVAATSSATVVGLPVAGVALAVAGVAQAGKYAYKYREEIGDAARWAGNKISDGAHWAGDKISDGAGAVKKGVQAGASFVGDKVGDGVDAVKKGVKAGADFVGDKVGAGVDTVKSGARAVGEKVADKVDDVKDVGQAAGRVLAGGARRLKGLFD